MSLRTKVKVGGITNLSDARYCAGMGADWLGFPVGEGGLTPETYRQLIDWVSGPEFVLEIDQTKGTPDSLKANYPGHVVQISTQQLSFLEDPDLQFIVVMEARQWPALDFTFRNHSNIRMIEVIASRDDFAVIREMASRHPVLVRLNNDISLEDALSLEPAGIALEGGQEERPGLRDYSALADVLEKLEVL